MINYGNDHDKAVLIAKKLGATDRNVEDVRGLVMKVLAMMGEQPNDLDAVVNEVINILRDTGNLNEGQQRQDKLEMKNKIDEATKHRMAMDAHHKRARQYLYSLPATPTDDESVEDTESCNNIGIESNLGESEETESTDGADGMISQDDDELTEDHDVNSINYAIDLDDEPNVDVIVSYTYTPDAQSPIDIVSISRVDNGMEIDPGVLTITDNYHLYSLCFNAVHDEAGELVEGSSGGASHDLQTHVSTPDEDDIDVVIAYSVDGDGQVNIQSIKRADDHTDISSQIPDYEFSSLEDACLNSYMTYARDENDNASIDKHVWNKANESIDDDYLDKRLSDYLDDAGPEPTKGTYKSWGKTFQTYTFSNDDDANAFMEENSGWGVIGVDDDGTVHVAKMDDTGVDESCDINDPAVIVVPRDQQKSLKNEIEVGGVDGPEQQQAYISRMKSLAGLK